MVEASTKTAAKKTTATKTLTTEDSGSASKPTQKKSGAPKLAPQSAKNKNIVERKAQTPRQGPLTLGGDDGDWQRSRSKADQKMASTPTGGNRRPYQGFKKVSTSNDDFVEVSKDNNTFMRASKTPRLSGAAASKSKDGGAFSFAQADLSRPKRKPVDKNLIEQVRQLGKNQKPGGGVASGETSGTFQNELAEIKQIVDQAARQPQAKVSIAQLTVEVINWIDSRQIGQATAGTLDYILRQPNIRDTFRHIQRNQDADQLLEKLLDSLKHASNKDNLASKEVLVRFIAHVCFCKHDILASDILEKTIKAVKWMILKPQKTNENEKQRQQEQHNLTKAALNCITNIYNREQQSSQATPMQASVKIESEFAFTKIKDLFIFLMRNIQNTYRSTRSVIMLTTVIRALQHVMDAAIVSKKLKLQDSDAIILFFEFYKLIFLGTKFTEKVLQIRVTPPQATDKTKQVVIQINDGGNQHTSDDGSKAVMIIDTSEAYSSDNTATKQGGGNGSNGSEHSARSIDQSQAQDSYLKIKLHAMQCLQILFRANNKSFNVNTLWHPIFPSFMIQPRPDLVTASSLLGLLDSKRSRGQFAIKAEEEVLKEPTLLYLMRAVQDNSSKVRQAACQTLTVLLENCETISKWQYSLEHISAVKADGVAEISIESLGLFLRLLHYYLVTLIESETTEQALFSELKLCVALLNATPYARMLPGLQVTLLETVVRQIKSETSLLNKWATKMPALMNLAIKVIQQGFESLTALRSCYSLATQSNSLATAVPDPEGLLKTTDLFTRSFLQQGDENIVNIFVEKGFIEIGRRECVEHYEPTLQLLAQVAQTFPDAMSTLWSDQFANCLRQLTIDSTVAKESSQAQGSATTPSTGISLMLQMQQNSSSQQQQKGVSSLTTTLGSGGSTTTSPLQRRCIVVSTFIKEWLSQFKDVDVDSHDNNEEDEKVQLVPRLSESSRPFTLASFTGLLRQLYQTHLNAKSSVELTCALVEILLCITRESEWKALFETPQETKDVLGYLVSLTGNSQPRQAAAANSSTAAVLRATQIQACSHFLVKPWMAETSPGFVQATFKLVFDSANDTNLQVAVRASQATTELSTYSLSVPANQRDQERDKQLLTVIMTFARSERFKVAANALRSLGYFLEQVDIPSIFDEESTMSGQIRQVVYSSLHNKSPKVSWNACIVIGKTIQNKSLERSLLGRNVFFDQRTVKTLFDLISSKPNIKVRIQAINALLCYQTVEQVGGSQLLSVALDTVSNCMEYKTHFKGSTAELSYLDTFEDGFLDLWLSVSKMLKQAMTTAADEALLDYLNSNSTFLLLQSVTDYLRKELKVPQYSGMFSDEAEFIEDTARLFAESPGNRLETKICKLKQSLELLLQTIESAQDIRVSFSVFEGIKSLAQSEIKDYRGLRVLKEIKSSFKATFGQDEEEEEEKKAAAPQI